MSEIVRGPLKFKRGWRHRRRWQRLQFVDEVPDMASSEPSPEFAFQQTETARFVRLTLQNLEAVDRRLIERHFGFDQEEMTLQELALDLGISAQAVHKRLKSALARLTPPVRQIFGTRYD